ncbi:MAG: serine--tRNA ligase [Endomicrobiia bacterium]
MIDINLLREKKDWLIKKLISRNISEKTIEEVLAIDTQKRKIQTELDLLRNQRKNFSNQIAQLKKQNISQDEILLQLEKNKESISLLENSISTLENQLSDILLKIPNIPDDTTPVGSSEKDNVVIKQIGEIPKYDFSPKPHWELGEKLGILDFVVSTKISGSRFVALKNFGCRLEHALIQFMLTEHIKNGYEEIWLPFLVNKETITCTGQLPKFAEEIYKIESEDFYLIPTAEVSVTNLYRDEVLLETELPKKFVSYSACFRKESGSYGKDTKGLIRNHQFNKIELVKFVRPEDSNSELESLTNDAANILQKLGLTYRIVSLCTADLGFASAKTYDLEVWMPGENRWREISSCSNCTDFQARRLNTKIKYSNGQKKFVHTLNGSGVAIGRTVACILETYQQKDGSIKIPEVLTPFLGIKVFP